MYILSPKLKLIKEKLKTWNKEVFGNIHVLVKEGEQKLNVIQEEINRNDNND